MPVFELLLHASVLIKLVLGTLAVLSICSWGIIFYKQYEFMKATKASAAFLSAVDSGASSTELLDLAQRLRASPLADLFAEIAARKSIIRPQRLRDAVARGVTRELERFQAYLTFLATTASTAPFIGLFGTVWGIIEAFKRIGTAGSASLAVVAPGIAEALVTTAAGLGVAIPAVIGYNYYLSRARRLGVELEEFSDTVVNLLEEARDEVSEAAIRSRGD